MTMSFKQLIKEAAANKVALEVETTEKDGKTIATFFPAGATGRSFTAEIDHYTARVIDHSGYAKARGAVSAKPDAETPPPKKEAEGKAAAAAKAKRQAKAAKKK